MSEDLQKVQWYQERIIVRLRAALRALGKTTEEINLIATDSFDGPDYHLSFFQGPNVQSPENHDA